MVTPRTHCHFVMQARALRVPEVCVNHTPPSCLVAYPFTKMEHRVLYMLVLPDPWLTQEGPVTFPACAHCTNFLPGRAIWHMMAYTRDTRVFNRTLDRYCNSRIAASVFDVSSPISIGHHHDRTLRNARNTKNIKIAANDHVACRISNQISQQLHGTPQSTLHGCERVNCTLVGLRWTQDLLVQSFVGVAHHEGGQSSLFAWPHTDSVLRGQHMSVCQGNIDAVSPSDEAISRRGTSPKTGFLQLRQQPQLSGGASKHQPTRWGQEDDPETVARPWLACGQCLYQRSDCCEVHEWVFFSQEILRALLIACNAGCCPWRSCSPQARRPRSACFCLFSKLTRIRVYSCAGDSTTELMVPLNYSVPGLRFCTSAVCTIRLAKLRGSRRTSKT